jgi:hypothetical protein
MTKAVVPTQYGSPGTWPGGRYGPPSEAAPRCDIDVKTPGVRYTELKIRRGDVTAPRCNLGRVYGSFLPSAGS